MEINKFVAGSYKNQIQYKSFLPEKINHDWIINSPEINSLLVEASRLLGELNAFSQLVPDVNFFIKMHITKEATTSSRIEGTSTNIQEALIKKEEDIAPEKRNDWKEVQNYIEATNYSIAQLEKIPLSNRLLKETHKVLLQEVRGKEKLPGEFRRSQNWIGATLKDAIYIPPHHEDVIDLMSDLEKFLNNDSLYVPHLIKIGIAHYQFETIHPFLDGNGRLGRLLITLYLVSSGLLQKPSLYISDFFERHRSHYFDNLMIARNNNISQWLKFFLTGIIETAQKSIQVFKDIIVLKDSVEMKKIPQMRGKAQKGILLLKSLYQNPIIDAHKISEILNVAPSTANRFIVDLEKLGILKELTGYKRNRKYVFKDYFDIFRK